MNKALFPVRFGGMRLGQAVEESLPASTSSSHANSFLVGALTSGVNELAATTKLVEADDDVVYYLSLVTFLNVHSLVVFTRTLLSINIPYLLKTKQRRIRYLL